MAWLEITVNTAPNSVEATAAALTAAGFSDLLIEDQQELEGFLAENRAYWDYIDEKLQKQLAGLSRIKLYLEDTDGDAMARLRGLTEYLCLTMTVETMEDTDWSESWKSNYPPQPVGKRLVVLPVWLAQQTEGRLPVILDPGLTFGTGGHPSTQMVMEAMEDRVCAGWRCLDLGSGSGILSITALRLGADSAVGVDIDPKAEDIARENAGFNGYAQPQFSACTGNVLTDRQLMDTLSRQAWDLVLVNIVADVIIALAPVLPRFLRRESLLICSGILDQRLQEVVAALEGAGLHITKTHAKEEWRCLEVTL